MYRWCQNGLDRPVGKFQLVSGNEPQPAVVVFAVVFKTDGAKVVDYFVHLLLTLLKLPLNRSPARSQKSSQQRRARLADNTAKRICGRSQRFIINLEIDD